MVLRGKPVNIAAAACACLLVLLWGPTALAAEPNWCAEWDAGLEEAKERNCPVILVAPFKRGTFAPSMFPEAFKDPQVVKLCGRFVCFYADHERFPKIDTLYAAKFVTPDSGKYGALQVIFIKPDGKEIEKLRLWLGVTKGKVLKNMAAALKSYPGSIPGGEYESCRKLRDRAEMLRKLGAYSEAIKAYEELGKKKSELQFVKNAKGKPEELRKEAALKVEEAGKALASDDPDTKKDALIRLHIYFQGMKKLKCHARVRELLAQAKKDRALTHDYSLGLKTAKAFEQFVKGETAYLDGNYKKAMKAYRRITRSYDETEFYDKAKDRIQEIVKKLTPKKPTTP